MSLGVFLDGETEQKPNWPEQDGHWEFGDVDFALYAMLCDPIYCAELLCESPANREYGGAYVVRDYQFELNRSTSNYEGYTCGRSTGKTESIKNRAMTHPFRRLGENLLITAPELIHLLPLTDSIEDRIFACRLTREFLDTDGGRTGVTHRPFGVDFRDGTKMVGRIPRQTGPQPVDAKLLTPDGWTTMGEVKVGDEVIGGDGKATRVLQVHDQGTREIFDLRFNDGSSARACADHRWLVSPTGGKDCWRIRHTRDLIEDFATSSPSQLGGRRNRWKVPATPCVEYSTLTEPLPLEPYLVGVLIGDGSVGRHTVGLTSCDPEILDTVRALLPAGCRLVANHGRKYSYRVTSGGRRGPGCKSPLRKSLEELGLYGRDARSKRIPETYMRASVLERLALLQGLMDTDGCVGSNGRTWFGSCCEALARQVAELARSLGAWASVRSQIHKPYWQELNGSPYYNKGGIHWRVAISTDLPVVRLRRKAIRLKPRKKRHRILAEIVPVGPVATRCISVESDLQQYLTDELIVTLNTGMKGQHEPDMIIDEAQDFPSAGWSEAHETVSKDHVDQDGNPDFSYIFYGVHSGARDTGFHRRATTGGFKIVQITALQRPGWCAAEKEAAKAAYGGTAAPDYRRNILGEAGAASSPLFVTARLVACMDQDRTSAYNQNEYQVQEIHVEAFDELMLPIADVLDLPSGLKRVWAGADLGLTNSPTVILIFSEEKIGGAMRLKLVRRIHLNRMRVKQIRNAIYAIFSHFGDALQGFGIDETGLGFPIMQEIEDDEGKPALMDERFSGWFFNARCPVGIEKGQVTADQAGNLRDQYGNAVQVRVNELTNEEEYIVYMPMIEASTRYLREFVDTTFFQFPFDPEVIGDMNGDSQQRVKRIAGLKQKPNAFHILDAMRAMSMIYKSADVAEAIAQPAQRPVLDGWAS